MNNSNNSKPSIFGKPIYSRLPNGPQYFAAASANGSASVSAFQVRVPLLDTGIMLIATAYGRVADKATGDVQFTVSMPGMGGRNARPVLTASDDLRRQFSEHVEAHAESWPDLPAVFSEAVDVLQRGPAAKQGAKLVWKASVSADKTPRLVVPAAVVPTAAPKA